jgi:spectrin beta
MEANDEKINSIVVVADTLADKQHFDADRIGKRAENIVQRRDSNRDRAIEMQEKLKNQVKLHEFLQDLEELNEWVQEKSLLARDDTYRTAKTVHSKWTRHQAFEAEIAANKDRLHTVENNAVKLMAQKPEFGEIIKPKLQDLGKHFEDLEETTKEKGAMLFDAKRETIVQQSVDDIDSWMDDLEKQIVNPDTGSDLTSVNILMQKQQIIQTQMALKAKQVDELDKQTEVLARTIPSEQVEPIVIKKQQVGERFERIKAPLLERQRQLEKKKEAFQFRRDVEDEKLWIDEKIPLVMSDEIGNSLFNVHMLKKNNQTLKTEIDNHEPRIMTICNNGQKLIDEGHEDASEFTDRISGLTQKWQELKDALNQRRKRLENSERVQQYFFDAQEAEAWMSEQELYMMVEDRGKDEISAQNLMKSSRSKTTLTPSASSAKQLVSSPPRITHTAIRCR